MLSSAPGGTWTPHPAPGSPITDPGSLDLVEYAGGVRATVVGEDGDVFLALGHDAPPALVLDAFRACAIAVGWVESDLIAWLEDPDALKQRYGAFTVHRDLEWWCEWSATEPGLNLLPVTVLEL